MGRDSTYQCRHNEKDELLLSFNTFEQPTMFIEVWNDKYKSGNDVALYAEDAMKLIERLEAFVEEAQEWAENGG